MRLVPDQNMKMEFQNTRRGVMLATSVGGSIVGRGGNRIVIDDPHNPTAVDSDVQRDAVVKYFSQALATRLDDKNRRDVVVMQRLHERDLSAHCRDLGYTQVCLPAEAGHRTVIVMPRSRRVIERQPGDLLWAARESRAMLEEQKRALGHAVYAAQYQQRPAPAKDCFFDANGGASMTRCPFLTNTRNLGT